MEVVFSWQGGELTLLGLDFFKKVVVIEKEYCPLTSGAKTIFRGTAQGKNAPGGEFDYIVKGSMIGGFAVLAYPAQYENSGVMTFMVNHEGVFYKKTLARTKNKQKGQ
jgi:hypothetical protein